MNKLFLITLLITAAFSSHAQHTNYLNLIENDWTKNKLKGKVKGIVRSDDFNGSVKSVTEEEYNEQGFLISCIITETKAADSGRKFVVANSFIYDTINSITRVVQIIEGTKSEEDIYEYNDYGKLVKVTYVSLNERGRLLKVHRNITSTAYTYDKKHRLLREMNFSGDSLVNETSWKYLRDGSKQSTFRIGKKKLKKSEMTESDSLKVTTYFTANEKPESSWIFRKDTTGRIIYTEGRKANGKLIDHTTFYHDQYGHVVKTVYYRAALKKTQTTYSEAAYDALGNWTSLKGIWNRKITYWEPFTIHH